VTVPWEAVWGAASAGTVTAHNNAVRENKSAPIKVDRTDATR
jgi:hypothetical protein